MPPMDLVNGNIEYADYPAKISRVVTHYEHSLKNMKIALLVIFQNQILGIII